MRDFKEFLEHERRVILNNIDRQQRALEWYKDDGDPLAQGHHQIIAVQERHLAMMDTLLEGDVDPAKTILTCEETLKLAEKKHREQLNQGRTNDDAWWHTLDVIQFLSALIYRIEAWQKHA